MKITNRTTEAIIAFGHHTDHGFGEDVRIEPGETKDVSGPYVGEMGGGGCFINLDGEIVCHSGPDDDMGFQVIKGKPFCLQSEGRGVTVRHHLDEPESWVKEWRNENVRPSLAMEPSYCLDVYVGYDESHREELIDFLQQTGKPFEIGMVQRGMWQRKKILRIETPKAKELQWHIYDGLHTGDDNDYVVYNTPIDAQRSDTWLPDLDTSHTYKRFSLADTATA